MRIQLNGGDIYCDDNCGVRCAGSSFLGIDQASPADCAVSMPE